MTRADQRLPRACRIRKRSEYLSLQRNGQRRTGRSFVVITRPRTAPDSRLGITASRRVGGAVVRNRIKRLVREFFRRHRSRVKPVRDVVVIARPAAAELSYAQLEHELRGALRIDVHG